MTTLREYVTTPRDFDGWLKANVFVGSIVAVLVLTMALAGLFSGGQQGGQQNQGGQGGQGGQQGGGQQGRR